MSLNPRSDSFGNEKALDDELRRQLYICHTCRLCFNLCPVFPEFFGKVDKADGDMKKLDYKELMGLTELCYQCKLCYVKCPYKPPHEFEVDVPRLLLRSKAVRAKGEGVSLQDKMLGSVDGVGKLLSATAPISNWANKNRVNRYLMHKVAGIHKDRLLPLYYRKTFDKWFKEDKAKTREAPAPKGKVALFYTCSVNFNAPNIGMASVRVLEKNGFDVVCPKQRCCGMPMLDGGDMDFALKNAEFNVKSLFEAVREGCDIVVPGPTCSYVLKREYPDLLGSDEAKTVAKRTYDISEYLVNLYKRGRLDTKFSHTPGRIAYHMPCHSKAQGVGYRSIELMRLIPGADVEFIDRGCSGMDGTWGMKKEFFDLSIKVGEGLIEGMKASGDATLVTDCPLAGLQIEQGTGRKPVHPVEVLSMAYGIER